MTFKTPLVQYLTWILDSIMKHSLVPHVTKVGHCVIVLVAFCDKIRSVHVDILIMCYIRIIR